MSELLEDIQEEFLNANAQCSEVRPSRPGSCAHSRCLPSSFALLAAAGTATAMSPNLTPLL
jgi:hypothetical protein